MILLKFALASGVCFGLGSSNGYVPRPRGKVSAKELKAMRASLGSAECIYGNLGDRMAMMEWDPEMFDVPKPCKGSSATDAKPEHRPICVGTVICHTQTVHFIVEKAICWASDQTHCPPPSKCAAISFLTSFDTFEEPGALLKMPVYMTTEPARSSK